MKQRTQEWFLSRCGKVGASEVHAMMAKTKNGYSALRLNLRAQKVIERLTGQPVESYVSPAMQHGIDTEDLARAAYCFHKDVDVEEVGFIDHPKIKGLGASPDGLIAPDGNLEIKCPNSATHVAMLLDGKIDKKYLLQVNTQMACNGRKWTDFVSFDPRMPIEMQIHITRVERDPALIAEIEKEARIFLKEVDDTVERLRGLYLTIEREDAA